MEVEAFLVWGHAGGTVGRSRPGSGNIFYKVHASASAPWHAQPDLTATTGEDRDPFMTARRAAMAAIVERLFPAAAAVTPADR
jgi:hypothetical protein